MSGRARILGLGVVLAAALAPASARAVVDVPPPTVTGPVGDNGWYIGPVTVTWHQTGDDAGSTGCDSKLISADTAGTSITCSADDRTGGHAEQRVVIRLDQTSPTAVVAAAARPPDARPFYTAPVAITWSGTDATSGIAACTTATYAGPDAATAAPTGACRDKAGNVSPPVALSFGYDATAPPLTALAATANVNLTVGLSWATTSDAQTATVVRNPGNVVVLNAAPATTLTVTDGPLGPATAFTYTVTLKDGAGNATVGTVAATTPTAAAVAAANQSAADEKAKAQAKKTRTLRWKAQRGAEYYNFQLFRNGRKVLSAWPTKNHYTLHSKWRFRGRTHRLAAGRYRWYVWPGYGRRAAHRYGRLQAKGAVAIPKST